MKHLKTIAILLLAAAIAFTAGCQKQPEAPLKVAALKGPTGMGLAYMMRDNTSEFSVEIYDAPDALTGKFISGEIDIAAVPVNLASVLYNKTGGEAIVIAVDTLGVLYVLENGDSVQSVSDLSGKTIYATGQGSTPEFILNYLLEQNGVTDAKVEFVGEHATLAAMAASGEAAIAMLPEPNVTAAMLKNDALRVALDLTKEFETASGKSLVQGCYIVRKSVYTENKKAVEAFTEACGISVGKVNSDPGAAALIAELGIVGSEAIAKNAIPRCNIVCITGSEMKELTDAMLNVLYEANPASIGGKLPGEDFYAE